MKKGFKIVFIVVLIALVCSAAAIYAAAVSSPSLTEEKMSYKPDNPNGYKYEIFVPSSSGSTTGKVTRYTDAASLVNNFKNAKTGSVIRLLSNITVDNSLNPKSGQTIYFDLNGYTIVQSLSGTGKVGTRVTTGATLYV